MKHSILLSAIFCLVAQLGMAQNAGPSFIWSAERKQVEKDGIKYRFIEVKTQKIDGTADGNVEFAESWARACQDSILLSKDKVTEVSNRFYKRYLKALREAETSGIYDYPVKDYKHFDITSIKYSELKKGSSIGLGAAVIVPMGEMSNLVGPMVGVTGELGALVGKGYLGADLTGAIGKQKNDYLFISGKDRKAAVPYISFAATYKYPVLDLDKGRLLLTAGAGYANAIVNNKTAGIVFKNNILAGGLMYTLGAAYDLKKSESFSFMRGKHKREETYLRFRLYTEQLCDLKEMVSTPMLFFSVSFVKADRKVKAEL